MDLNEYYLRNTTITDKSTVWISQAMLRKFCNVSESYLAKVRTLYKQSLPNDYEITYFTDTYHTCYILEKSRRSWRWGVIRGQYFYDYDTIPTHKPTRYRDNLPTRLEIIREINAIESYQPRKLKGYGLRVENLRKLILSDSEWVDYGFDTYGFGKVKVRHLELAATWILFIKRILWFGLYLSYGFDNQEDFLFCCVKALVSQKVELLKTETTQELHDKIHTIPDDFNALKEYVISRFKN